MTDPKMNVALVLVLLLGGCATSQGKVVAEYHHMDDEEFSSRTELPRILEEATGDPREHGYLYIGSLTVEGGSKSAALEQAAKRGADAVVYHSGKKYGPTEYTLIKPLNAWGQPHSLYRPYVVEKSSVEADVHSFMLYRHDRRRAYADAMAEVLATPLGRSETQPPTKAVEVLLAYLAKGADPNGQDRSGTPLLYLLTTHLKPVASYEIGQGPSAFLLKNRPKLLVEIAEVMLDAGADPNAVRTRKDRRGPTLLYLVEESLEQKHGSSRLPNPAAKSALQQLRQLLLRAGARSQAGSETTGGFRPRVATTLKIETTGGSFEFVLFAEEAPTVAQKLLSLAQSNVFVGCAFAEDAHEGVFHLIPGGRPTGEPFNFPAEFPAEATSRPHQTGSVGVAWTDEGRRKGFASLYVVAEPHADLDRRGIVIGQVGEGSELLPRLAAMRILRVRPGHVAWRSR